MADQQELSPIAAYEQQIQSWRRALKREYDRAANRDLSRQNSEGLLMRNITQLLAQGYDLALERVSDKGLGEADRDALLAPFDGVVDELLAYAVQKHRTSCAFSNFPLEHTPSREYIAEVLQQVEEAWQSFCHDLTDLLSTPVSIPD